MKNSELYRRWETFHKGLDTASMMVSFANHLEYSLSKDQYTATTRDLYQALALTVRDRLVERWIHTQQTYYKLDVKMIYYLSAEYLLGRALVNNLINLGNYRETIGMMKELNIDLADLVREEPDAGLGNGGLGRLAACFLESMATLELPAVGYGLRYEFGIFEQVIRDGGQLEHPDEWLKYGNPWEIVRPERTYIVRFYGRVNELTGPDGSFSSEWTGTTDVIGLAHDMPVGGFGNSTVNTLRLWAARASHEFDLTYFQHGDYLKAVEEKNLSENISKVLYPNDNIFQGQELRLRQQYFFISCSIQDIIRRYLVNHRSFDLFPDKVAIQLNDTHPSLAITELMRIFLDEYRLGWDEAWDITNRVFAFTNHTLLTEALEKWPVAMLERILPRHLRIIYEINRRFLRDVSIFCTGDAEQMARMSLIEEGPEKKVRMAHLAIVGSHSVNGVSALHTSILKEKAFPDFNRMFPQRFNNKTNGVTPRRWLLAANQRLSDLISGRIGQGWIRDLEELGRLEPLADDAEFRWLFREVKAANKRSLAVLARQLTGMEIDPSSIFDVQVKRIHEYKRQLLNILNVIVTWLEMKENPGNDYQARTCIFGGTAAPEYQEAKSIIRLICLAADMINHDPATSNRLKVVFLPNYRVALAERIIPAADLSEQISTAGYEASGTSNMKFALNGALTIGTLDGANVEIFEAVGADNIFIFGLTAQEVADWGRDHDPAAAYRSDSLLKHALDLIRDGFFSPEQPGLFRPLVENLLSNDRYLVLADFEAYRRRHGEAEKSYGDAEGWSKKAVLNMARCGRFSSDRAIREYNRDIWGAVPLAVGKERSGL